MKPADHTAIFSYENKPAMQLESDAERDQELITNGIKSRLAAGVKGTDITADYTPDSKYPHGGEFHLSLPVLAEGEVPAIRTLISELTKLTCNLPD